MGKQESIGSAAGQLRIVRYDDLRPCFDAFIDTRTPGSDQKENFTIIGPGVSENLDQYVHIKEPHGFNIGGARQPPGCVNSQHSHHTAEVFFVHTGTWSFDIGEHGDDANITLKPGDLISIPTNVFRGFKNIGKDLGFLWGVLGGDDPGRVMWAPDVFEMAKNYGLVLMENGMLVDTAKGEVVPDGKNVMPVTTREQIAALDIPDEAQLRACCILSNEKTHTVEGDGVKRRSLIGSNGKIKWDHGFTMSQFDLGVGASTDMAAYDGPDVVFVHQGNLRIETYDDQRDLGSGDTATIPKGVARRFINIGNEMVDFVRVQGDV
ncbi:MAG: cupin domain-containing protein [Hyphomonadaceae bacterium]|nr:cupin domain-containing protein [Hyphomonadaceae bacterium]